MELFFFGPVWKMLRNTWGKWSRPNFCQNPTRHNDIFFFSKICLLLGKTRFSKNYAVRRCQKKGKARGTEGRLKLRSTSERVRKVLLGTCLARAHTYTSLLFSQVRELSMHKHTLGRWFCSSRALLAAVLVDANQRNSSSGSSCFCNKNPFGSGRLRPSVQRC